MLKRKSTVFILCYLEKSCQTCEDFKDGSVDFNQRGHANSPERALYSQKSHTTGFENESAALIDAHLKKYKFRTEDDTVATQSSIDWTIRMQHRL